jgi:hypothetical protein
LFDGIERQGEAAVEWCGERRPAWFRLRLDI